MGKQGENLVSYRGHFSNVDKAGLPGSGYACEGMCVYECVCVGGDLLIYDILSIFKDLCYFMCLSV